MFGNRLIYAVAVGLLALMVAGCGSPNYIIKTGGYSGSKIRVSPQNEIEIDSLLNGDTVFFYQVQNGHLYRGPIPSVSANIQFCLPANNNVHGEGSGGVGHGASGIGSGSGGVGHGSSSIGFGSGGVGHGASGIGKGESTLNRQSLVLTKEAPGCFRRGEQFTLNYTFKNSSDLILSNFIAYDRLPSEFEIVDAADFTAYKSGNIWLYRYSQNLAPGEIIRFKIICKLK